MVKLGSIIFLWFMAVFPFEWLVNVVFSPLFLKTAFGMSKIDFPKALYIYALLSFIFVSFYGLLQIAILGAREIGMRKPS